MSSNASTASSDIIYIGNATDSRLLALCNAVCAAYPFAGDPSTIFLAREYIILLDTLADDEISRVPRFAAALKAARPGAIVRNAETSDIQSEIATVLWGAENGTTFANIRLPLAHQIVPCIKFGGDLNSESSRDWYHKLLNFALNKTAIDKRCCVLHGPSGVGKTLAIERIVEILAASKDDDIKLLAMSAAMIDSDNCDTTLNQMVSHARGSRDNILVIDDFDAGVPKRVVERFEKLQCRRIVICNNLFEREHTFLRNKYLYFDIAVNKLSLPALNDYLGECFPSIARRRCWEIAESANGDARSALIHAKWESMHSSTAAAPPKKPEMKLVARKRKGKLTFGWKLLNADEQDDDEGTKDSSITGEIPAYAILRCMRAKQGSVLEKCDRVFGEGDIDTPSQLLFENHCRYNTSGDLNSAALLLEMQSIGDVYEQLQWKNQFDGSDASLTDKHISFALSFSGPCSAMSKCAAPNGVRVYPKMNFPFSTLRRSKHESALAIRRMESNRLSLRYVVDREAIKAASLSFTAFTESTLEWSRMMFNRIVGPVLKKAIDIVLMPAKDRPAKSVIYEELGTVVRQFGLHGMDGADFAYACRRHAALFTFPDRDVRPLVVHPLIALPSNYDLERVFEHYAPTVTASDAELVDDTIDAKPAPKRAAKKKKTDDDEGDEATKKRKTTENGGGGVKKRQSKILDMLQRQNSAKSVVSARKN